MNLHDIKSHYRNVADNSVGSPFSNNTVYDEILINKLLSFTRGKTLLDIGCGSSDIGKRLLPKKLISVDVSKELLFKNLTFENQEKY